MLSYSQAPFPCIPRIPWFLLPDPSPPRWQTTVGRLTPFSRRHLPHGPLWGAFLIPPATQLVRHCLRNARNARKGRDPAAARVWLLPVGSRAGSPFASADPCAWARPRRRPAFAGARSPRGRRLRRAQLARRSRDAAARRGAALDAWPRGSAPFSRISDISQAPIRGAWALAVGARQAPSWLGRTARPRSASVGDAADGVHPTELGVSLSPAPWVALLAPSTATGRRLRPRKGESHAKH